MIVCHQHTHTNSTHAGTSVSRPSISKQTPPLSRSRSLPTISPGETKGGSSSSTMDVFFESLDAEKITNAFTKLLETCSEKSISPAAYLLKHHKDMITHSRRRYLNELVSLLNKSETSSTAPRVLVIGAGPVGLRTALGIQIEIFNSGKSVVVFESRKASDTFSRFNILHLWQHTRNDLKRFGVLRGLSGTTTHLGTNTIQAALYRSLLLCGGSVKFETEFLRVDSRASSWCAEYRFHGKESKFNFDVIVGCGGKSDVGVSSFFIHSLHTHTTKTNTGPLERS